MFRSAAFAVLASACLAAHGGDFWFAVNEDNDHFFKCDSAEMTREGLLRYADYVARGKVTHVFLCVNGQRTSYDSKTWEPIWAGLDERARPDTATRPDGTHDRWAVNCKILRDAGIDPYDVWIRRFRERGVSPWVSMRMNDVHFANDTNYFRNTTFHKAHPEWRIDPKRPWFGWQLDFAVKEVRDYTMAQVREIAERWDSDGIELDWMRFGNALRPGEERKNAHLLDGFMREARRAVDAAGKAHGRKMKLAVRVPPTIASAEAAGFNVVAWAREGLVDVVIPDSFIVPMTDLPVAEWLAALKNTDARLLPGTGSTTPKGIGEPKKSVEWFRGISDWRAKQGASGVYFFNLPYRSNKKYSTDGGGDALDVAATLYSEGVAPSDLAGREKTLVDSPGDVAPPAARADRGRQLFVDDALIASTNGVVRHWDVPVKRASPVLRPTSPDGKRISGCTVATDGGLWWDPTRKVYRLWYENDWAGVMHYAESSDGVAWRFPDLGAVKGTNRVFPDSEDRVNVTLDSWSVWPDYAAANPYSSWKMLVSAPGRDTADSMFSSPDGFRFKRLGVAGYSGDRTTMHYDSILGKWVFSLRDYRPPLGRCRRFHAQTAFVPDSIPYASCTGTNFPSAKTRDAEKWTTFDRMDFGPRGSLYNFDAVPYESLMLGVMEVLHNTPRDNGDSEEAGLPKQTSLRFAFSRDGKNYVSAPASAIRPEGWGSGKWDTGYLSAIGGICTTGEREMRFYYSALRGDAELRRAKVGPQPMHKRGIYYNGAIGFATLRRDGFCGLVADGKGEIVTKPLFFSEGRRLFVNAECLYGEVAAEILDEAGKTTPGFTLADCREMKYDDSTKRELAFAGGDLSRFAGKRVRVRFALHCATLYAFWVSPSARGESRGFVAAGGPDYRGLRDD